MASFNHQEIFGNYATYNTDPEASYILQIDKTSFMDTDNYGNLPVGIGINSFTTPTPTQILYGILLILMQNQAETINTDPTQKVYVIDAGKSIATGVRDGQVRRSFTVSFFIDAGLAGTPSINQIDPPVAVEQVST
jgi:hypothetical protein